MRILIIHAHVENRGDESAVKALVDELLDYDPTMDIVISPNGMTLYPNMPKSVRFINRFPVVHSYISYFEYLLVLVFGEKLVFTRECKEFFNALNTSDIVIHAPGGPSIGDVYLKREWRYLANLNLIRKKGIKYMFYAPSMGPFECSKHNKIRKLVLDGAECIVVRDPISYSYITKFAPETHPVQALDSALQHDVNTEIYEPIYEEYKELKDFLGSHKRCIGITYTDLKWHPNYQDPDLQVKLENVFRKFINKRINEGYGIVFIPQLYGRANDTLLMNKFMEHQHTFMLDSSYKKHDAYFQQYIIDKLYAVIGMRYHSNIFSAKMSTPFVSISYEQKMRGFMQITGLNEFCIDVKELSYESLDKKYLKLVSSYENYKKKLDELHPWMKEESQKTTKMLISILENRSHKY